MSKIKPLGRNILVKPIEDDETVNSNIVLPDKEKDGNPQKGEVLAIGDSKDIYSEIKEGATVIFRQFSGDKVALEGEDYIILDAKKDVVAVIE